MVKERRQQSPKDYVRLACDLHLNVELEGDELVDVVDGFVKQDSSDLRLFVWVEDSDTVKASTESLPHHANQGAIVFLRAGGGGTSAAGGSSASRAQLQCMTLQARSYPEEKSDEVAEAGEEKKVDDGNNPATLEVLQMYARHCFVPAVQSLQDEKEQAKVLESLEDKLRELDVALGQARRSALSQIPKVKLMAHPALAKVAAEHEGQSMSDLDGLGLADKVQDDEFLNAVQAGVSQWIVQIRKVTVLPTTTAFPSIDSSGSADLEEVSFWTQLEETLKEIPQELQKPEVQLTLNLLKAAKRFIATIALDNNTGLEQALGHASDVAHYLRNYPAPQVEAARDWEKLTTAVIAVMDHLPKVRSSRYYDLERCAKLMEATTLTMRRRMLGILKEQPQNILFMDYDEYESDVYYPTFDVFVQFDEKYAEFSEFFLEQGRRRKIKPSAILSSLTLHHLPVKKRLDDLHELRQSHHKLQVVLKEVLEENDETIRQVDGALKANLARLMFWI